MTPDTDRNYGWGDYDFKAPLRRVHAETYEAKIYYEALLRHHNLRGKTSQYASENPTHSHLTDRSFGHLMHSATPCTTLKYVLFKHL